jgi:hypothetical protein
MELVHPILDWCPSQEVAGLEGVFEYQSMESICPLGAHFFKVGSFVSYGAFRPLKKDVSRPNEVVGDDSEVSVPELIELFVTVEYGNLSSIDPLVDVGLPLKF